MTTLTPIDLFYLSLAIAVIALCFFLCWVLFETAMILRNANSIVKDVQERIAHLEEALTHVKDRIESVGKYAGTLMQGGKTIASYFHKDEEKPRVNKGRKSRLLEEDDSEE